MKTLILHHVRFFKDVHLLEIGANLKGKINLNYVLGIKKELL